MENIETLQDKTTLDSQQRRTKITQRKGKGLLVISHSSKGGVLRL